MNLNKLCSFFTLTFSLFFAQAANSIDTINGEPFDRSMAVSWTAVDSDANNGAIALAHYVNENLSPLAKLARVAICFVSMGGPSECKNLMKGADPSVFSASLLEFDSYTSLVKINLKINRIFYFGSSNNTYEADITIRSGYTLNGCSFSETGTPKFIFENEGNSKLTPKLINSLHDQFVTNSSKVLTNFFTGNKNSPGFLSSCY